jgi:hypothetical protein
MAPFDETQGAEQLTRAGINVDSVTWVDLAVNLKNPVIARESASLKDSRIAGCQ